MEKKTFSIFGAGAAGLYTAWRLLDEISKKNNGLSEGDTLELYDWGKYNFAKDAKGTREAAGRICTKHFQDDPKNSYVELGGMRYSYWNGNNNGTTPGHRLVTQTIKELGLDKDSIPFNVSGNELYYLRGKNIYNDDITSTNPVPYNIKDHGNTTTPDTGFSALQGLAMTNEEAENMTRKDWCNFYQHGKIRQDTSENSVFKKGDKLKDIGYWNLMFDQLGSEGYLYTAAGNGYSSNVINWNSAEAINANNEFTPGSQYKTLKDGYSSLFSALFQEIKKLAKKYNIKFCYYPNIRLRSIYSKEGKVHFTTARREAPNKEFERKTTDYSWMAMPRAAIELVAQATRYDDLKDGVDVLNDEKVQLYLESAIIQPSYKIGMFFEEEWWKEGTAKYPAKLTSYGLTADVIKELAKTGFPEKYLKEFKEAEKASLKDKEAVLQGTTLFQETFPTSEVFLTRIESILKVDLTYKERTLLLEKSERDTIGPSTTDTPIRQVVYFGNNAQKSKKPVYGILASYDDEEFADFWKELELGPGTIKKIPTSADLQPLEGPKAATKAMVKMLKKQLAHLHFGPSANASVIPEPLECTYMDWSLPPFYAGYHAYAAHYNICDVQQKIRKPSSLLFEEDANIFIVGETYSNDQAWVEGAFGTAESVLNDFFDIKPIIDNSEYPFICSSCEL